MDRAYSPKDIISLLPADSSQTAASLAAAEGRDFVIVGPPGTGKSQTIANMIANCLAVGKTVLFVAEKTAALDVVYRRLRERGLGTHCIELHSNKADRKHFVGQLKRSWEHDGSSDASEWVAINERLRVRRDELNAYVNALHKRYANGWTPYLALGTALKSSESAAPVFDWQGLETHDEQTLHLMEELAAEVGLIFSSVKRAPGLDLVNVDEWSSMWQDELLDAAQSLRNSVDILVNASAAYFAILNLDPMRQTSPSEIWAFVKLAAALAQTRGYDVTISFDKDFAQCAGALSDLERSIKSYRGVEQALPFSFSIENIRALNCDAIEHQWRIATAAVWPNSLLAKRKVQKQLQSYAIQGTIDPQEHLPSLRLMMEQLSYIDQNPLVEKPLPVNGLETDIKAIAGILDLAGNLRNSLRIPGQERGEMQVMLRSVATCLGGDDNAVRQAGERLLSAARNFKVANSHFSKLSGSDVTIGLDGSDFAVLSENLGALGRSRHLLRDWSTWCRVKKRALALNITPLVEGVEKEAIRPENARSAFRLGYSRWWLPKVLDSDPVLRDFRRFQHENAIKEFREIDDLVRSHAAGRVISAIAHGLPSVQGVARNSELGLLRHQMELQRPSQSIRDMIGKLPQSFSKLAPCMLMSPLSIAQYLPPNQALFDVVIFDEASQITTWDAVGAIARARQTIIVGDPKQLPPTNFFGRNEDDEEIADHEKDLESILDEAKASGIPIRDLRWHYRSRSESLIAFSNYHYYQNRLVTFPSPLVNDHAVNLIKVPNGIYDRGKSRTNKIEAQAVTDAAVSRMKAWLLLPETERSTLGIITFNAQQQSLILDLLDAARRANPDLEWFFADDRVEPTIVKNLENVQGDERDTILFSITFWKDSAGKLAMDFGALNKEGGERRLNVAVTRARRELLVFSGFTADQIDTSRTKAIAVQHLKTFLDFAERGAIALPAHDVGSVGGFESPFEEAVAAQLEKRGWIVIPQVGISGFRIDLGIRHPDFAGSYLAGVECDGATYHGSATARDRDKIREDVLTGLGWNILRVWSTDWWFDSATCAERLHSSLESLLEKDRAKRAAELALLTSKHNTQSGPSSNDEAFVQSMPTDLIASNSDHSAVDASGSDATLIATSPITTPENVTVEVNEPAPVEAQNRKYQITDLTSFQPDPERFFESTYSGKLRAMIGAVMATESPLRKDILAQRIARAHGWLRTGLRISETIDRHLREFDRTEESSGDFIWNKGTVSEIVAYRQPANESEKRSIVEIPLAEISHVLSNNLDLLEGSDAAKELASLLGAERLAAVSRARVEEAIARIRRHVSAPQSSE